MRRCSVCFGVATLTLAVFVDHAAAQKVLLLVNDPTNLINLDPDLVDRMESRFDAEVTVERADNFNTAELDALAREHDIVIISESLGSGTTLENGAFKLQQTPVPVVSFEAYMWEDAFWVELPQFDGFGNTGRTDLIGAPEAAGLEEAQTEMYITAMGADHPLSAGFDEGPLTVYNELYSVNFGQTSPNAKVIATADAAGEFPAHFIYEEGDELVNGTTAPAARVGLFFGQAANPNANFAPRLDLFHDNAWRLFDAVLELGLGPLPDPGDFNEDGTVDLADYEILKANFNTDARFRQGDMDFSGRVDLRDFTAFVEVFNANAAAVPEPGTLWLLLLGAGAVPWAKLRRRIA